MASTVARKAGVEGHAAIALAFTRGRSRPLPCAFGSQLPLSFGLREAREMARDARGFDQSPVVRAFGPQGGTTKGPGHLDECLAGGVGLVFLKFEPTDLLLKCCRCRRKLLANRARPGVVCGFGITVPTQEIRDRTNEAEAPRFVGEHELGNDIV